MPTQTVTSFDLKAPSLSVFQECTHLVSTTWHHLLPTLGHPKIGLHPLRTGQQQDRHHLQVYFSLSLTLIFLSVCLCHCTRQIRSVCLKVNHFEARHQKKKGVPMSHLLHIKIAKDKQSPVSLSSPIFISSTSWISVKSLTPAHGVSLVHLHRNVSLASLYFKRSSSRTFPSVRPRGVAPCSSPSALCMTLRVVASIIMISSN